MEMKGNDITDSVSDSSSPEDDYTMDSDSSSPKGDDITDSVSVESPQVSMEMKEEIICTYRKMETQSKWRLSTGKYVEDALFNFSMTVVYEQ